MDTATLLIVIAAIGAQVGIAIAAIFAGIAARDARRIALDTKVETQAQTAKIDTVVTDTAVVLGHVNSEKTAGEGRENTLKRENELLREMLAEKQATAGLLAQAVASRGRSATDAPTPAADASLTNIDAQQSLTSIDAATTETAANTRATERKVDALKDQGKP